MKQIIDETYHEEDSSATPVSLVNYFEKRLNEVDYLSLKNYLINEDIFSIPMQYNPITKCYRVVLAQTEIDFPSNWSIFNTFQEENLVAVRASFDEDYLCEIFLSYVGDVKIMAIAKENDQCHMIFLTTEDAEKNLDWFENYFAKKLEVEEKKAA